MPLTFYYLGQPNVMAHHKTDNENHSFRLMGEVFKIDQNPPVQNVFLV